MTAEQQYCLTVMQLPLVMLIASTRIQQPPGSRDCLRWLQLALLADALGWLFYLERAQLVWRLMSSMATALELWSILLFVLSRCGYRVRWQWFVLPVLLQGGAHTLLGVFEQGSWSLHLMLLIGVLTVLPSAWLMAFRKPRRNQSDRFTVLALLLFLGVLLLRSVLVFWYPKLAAEDNFIAQMLWPGILLALWLSILTSYLEEAQQRLRNEAMLDPLTGLLNRRGLEYSLHHGLAQLARQAQGGVVLLLDLDHFKRVNDQFGHDAGDRMLQRVAAQLQHSARASDVVARLGGEEFLIFLPAIDAQQASHSAERLRHSVEQMSWPDLGGLRQTVSIGLATLRAGEAFSHAQQRADVALYQAKSSGRNRVQLADATG